jgi:hypothetical protein
VGTENWGCGMNGGEKKQKRRERELMKGMGIWKKATKICSDISNF